MIGAAMPRRLVPASLALTLLLSTGLASANPLARMAWLQGCWGATGGAEAGSIEQWSGPAGGTMIGASRTIKGNKTVAYEFLQIREVEPNVLAYIPQPQGRAPTVFKMSQQTDTETVFENPEHDFPQRIIYRRNADGTLHARIEGMSKGKMKGIDFPMKRVSCEASPG
jgi:hypothetical protein